MSRKKLLSLIDEISVSDEKKYANLFHELKKICYDDFYKNEPIPEKGFLVKKIIENYKDSKNIRILDHGCGAGTTIFYLIGLGYYNVVGYDVLLNLRNRYTNYNKFLNFCLNTNLEYFNLYEGINLTEKNKTIDVINSQAVMEHLDDQVYNKYLSEQIRVLKKNGIGIHIIPQRLQFYDSHNRMLFVHWLPRNISIKIYKLFKVYNADINLHLRTTFYHLIKLKKFYGETFNHSLEYYMNKNIKTDDLMDGKKKRGLIFQICNTKILNLFLPFILKYSFMHVSLSRRIHD